MKKLCIICLLCSVIMSGCSFSDGKVVYDNSGDTPSISIICDNGEVVKLDDVLDIENFVNILIDDVNLPDSVDKDELRAYLQDIIENVGSTVDEDVIRDSIDEFLNKVKE